MKQRSALAAVAAIVLVTAVLSGHDHGAGATTGRDSGSRGGSENDPRGPVSSTIDFHGAECAITRDDAVSARSGDDVTWEVSVEKPCRLEGRQVEIVFTDGDPSDPSVRCQCTAMVRNNKAKLKLHVKKHEEPRAYTYNIKAGGKTYHPRLEIDP